MIDRGDPIYITYKAVDFAEDFHTDIWSDTGLAKAIDCALADPCSLHETSCVGYGPNNYVVASFVATGVCDENDELLAILASQLQITTPENDLSDLFTTETYSVFEDSATLMADVASTVDCITADKRRVLYVVGDRSRPQTPLVGRAGFASAEIYRLCLPEDSDTDVLRQFSVDPLRAWGEYTETDELRRVWVAGGVHHQGRGTSWTPPRAE